MKVGLSVLLWLGALLVFAQENSGIPFIHNYSPSDYHQGTQNFAILKDSKGILYVGNNNGVIEFDGNQFYLIPLANRSEVHSLASDSSGKIYVGGQGDFGYLKPDSLTGRMRYVSLLPKLETQYRNFNDVWAIHITPREVVFRSTTGIYVYRNGQIKATLFKSSNHRSFFVNGDIYVREENIGLRKLVNDTLKLVPEGDSFLNEGIYGMLSLSDKRCLVLTGSKGFFIYDGNHFEPLPSSANQLVSGQINFSEKLSENRFAIVTRRSGLVIIDSLGSVVSRVSKAEGLQDNSIWHVFQDGDDLWLAENNGFSLVEFSSPFTVFGKFSGLDGQFYNMVKHGEYVYAAGTTGVYYKKWSKNADPIYNEFRLVKDLDFQSWHFYEDSTHVLVTTNRGVFDVTNGIAKSVGYEGRAWFFLALKNFPGYVLVNTSDGLLILKKTNNGFTVHSIYKNPVANFYIFAQDEFGNIWADNPTQGIYRIQFEKGITSVPTITLYNAKQGLPSNLKIRAFETSTGVLFGTEKGIYRFDKQKNSFYPDTALNKLLAVENDYVEYIDEAPWGDIGFTAKRVNGDYEEWLIGIAYKKEDGSKKVNTDVFQKITNFKVNDFLFVDKGNIFLPTSDGIVHFNSVKENTTHFSVLVRKLELLKTDSTVFQGTAARELQSKLPFSFNDLRFTVASTDMRSPTSTHYQYFLEGSDQEWSAWTNVNVKEYTNLQEGKYVLHIRARNQYYMVSEVSDFAFTIAAPWYRTIVAYIGYLAVATFVLYIVLVLYAKKLKNEKIRLEQLIDERTQEIKRQSKRILEKNNQLEIQKAEINAQNENIRGQNDALEKARLTIAEQVAQLKTVNQGLEEKVEERTKQLQDAYEDLLAIKNELDTFVYRSSHDINGPLMRLRGLCRTALVDVKEQESLTYFKLLDLEVDVMSRMLQKLIFFYNIKNSDPKEEPIELRSLIDKAIKRQESIPGFNEVHFEISVPEVKTVVTDNELLSAAVSNLIENAVMYRNKEAEGVVKIKAERFNGTLKISVRDNGLGIDKAIGAKVFDMFFRGTERSSGAGLGLYIAREAIKRLNGEIKFTSEVDTTFVISVPVR